MMSCTCRGVFRCQACLSGVLWISTEEMAARRRRRERLADAPVLLREIAADIEARHFMSAGILREIASDLDLYQGGER